MSNAHSAHVTILQFADGRELCCSYGVPVAGFVPGRGYLGTTTFYSVTTSRHRNAYLKANPGHDRLVPDADLRAAFPELATLPIIAR